MSGLPLQGRRESVHLLALFAMVVCVFGPLLVTGRTCLSLDLSFLFYPGYVFFRDAVWHGALPLWNPYMGCGEPFLADLERGVFYLPNLIYLVVPTTQATVITAAFHVLLAGVGAYVLSRTWGVSPAGSLLAGVGYAFNAFTLAKIQFPSQLGSMAWLPMVVAAYAFWLKDRNRRRLLLLSGALCMQFLSGHPETVVFSVGALVLYAVFVGVYDVRASRRASHLIVPLLGLAGAGCLVILLSMAQLLPTLEALQASARAGTVDPMLEKASINPLALFTLLVPSVYGIGGWHALSWAPGCRSPAVGAFNVGLVPIVILIAVVIQRIATRARPQPAPSHRHAAAACRVPFLVTLSIVFFFYAMGKYTPFFALSQRLVPLLQRFIWPPKCLLCVVLALSCLAGIALDWFAANTPRVQAGRSWWSRLAGRWGTVLLFAGIGVLIAVCLVRHGAVGKVVLARCFNLDAVPALRRGNIPWDVLLIDSIKLPVVGMLVGVLLYIYAFRARLKAVACWLLILLAFADVIQSNYRLLCVGPGAVIEEPPRYLEKFRPPDRLVRFLGLEHGVPDQIWRNVELLTKGQPTCELKVGAPGTYQPEVIGTVIRPLREILYSSWAMGDRAFNASSLNNFVSRDVQKLVFLSLSDRVSLPMRKRLLAMMNCDRIVMTPHLRRAFVLGGLRSVPLVMLDEPLPRAYVVGGVEVLDDSEAVIAAMAALPFDPLEVALIGRSSAQGESFADLRPGKVAHRVTHIEYGQNTLTIDVESRSAGLLVISDAYAPGWRADVNGKRVPVYRINGGFRGVRIESGINAVRMRYAPRSVQVGIAVSLASLVVMLIVLLPARRSPRRPAANG